MAKRPGIPDPMEKLIAEALDSVGIRYVRDAYGNGAVGLDFYLPDSNLHIEVKRFHSDRIADQITRAANVIVAQGEVAVWHLANLIRATEPANGPRPQVRHLDRPLRQPGVRRGSADLGQDRGIPSRPIDQCGRWGIVSAAREDREVILRLINASQRAAEELEHQAEAQRAAILRLFAALQTGANPR